MSTLFFVNGITGVGKSEACRHLVTNHRCTEYAPYRFTKFFLECHYGLAPGALDTVEGKSVTPDGMNIDLHTLMVDMFTFYRDRDPQYTTRDVRRTLPALLEAGDVCINSVRNWAEVGAVRETVRNGKHRLCFIDIHRHTATMKSSDYLVSQFADWGVNHANYYAEVQNDGDIESLFATVDHIVKGMKYV